MKKNILRQKKILEYLVEIYISTSTPVSSKLLCEKYSENISPATIRIDLNKLEKGNFIYQPHTSAGRIPTIQGYRAYIDLISDKLKNTRYESSNILQKILIKYYRRRNVSRKKKKLKLLQSP